MSDEIYTPSANQSFTEDQKNALQDTFAFLEEQDRRRANQSEKISLDEPKPLADYRSTLAAVRGEEAQREEVMHSPEYLLLEAQKRKIEGAQALMLAHIPDSSEELAMDKAELLQFMQDNQRPEIGEFKAKPRQNRRVDTHMLMDACDGDLDMFNTIVSCPQSAINNFCEGISDPALKRRLKACIVLDGVTYVDILPLESDE